jgi:hypothetical protein
MRRMIRVTFIAVAVLAAVPLHAAGPRSAGKDAPGAAVTKPIAPAVTAKTVKSSPYTLSNVSIGATPTVAPASSAYSMDWYSINSGGTIHASSASYDMGASVGQPEVGKASSASYDMNAGFWAGASGGCNCQHQGDMQPPDGSGFIDVSDVLKVIGIAFTNGADVTDPGCPKSRGDVNNSGFVDVNDVLYIIKTAFTNGPPPVNPCGP